MISFAAPLIPARFLRREKRFLAEVERTDGRRLWVHVPNSGALTGCASPGLEILLTADGRPGRKTSHSWRFSRIAQGWTCIDTLAPNRLVAGALAAGGLPGLPRPVSFRAEAPLSSGARLDFAGDLGGRLFFLEVKSVTWVEDGVALFPDGVTSRGRRHLEELAALAAQGHEAWQVFVVQRQDARRFQAAARVDPAYARELARAAHRGVKILVLSTRVEPPNITLASALPFDLSFPSGDL
jgi:sugar fermentation stimulation protein A